jgi:aminopeptidase
MTCDGHGIDNDPAQSMRRYAELAVRVGANVATGQPVFVQAPVEHAPLAREVALAAYDAGASFVDVNYTDAVVRRLFVEAAGEELLSYSPPWLLSRLESAHELRAAEVLLVSPPDPALFAGLDEDRIGRAQPKQYMKRMMEIRAREQTVNWTLVAAPGAAWAEQLFGRPDLGRLWQLVEQAVRLDDPDPIGSWRTHLAGLEARADELNRWRFDTLHFRGPGTDLTVGLLDVSCWATCLSKTLDGREYCINLPTEEVFTTPDPVRTEGTVRATRPFIPMAGAVVEGLALRFEEGRIVDVRARSGEEIVRAQLEGDPNAPFLGEVALVDADSRVGRLGTIFGHTLLDENATCHIAYGNAIPKGTNYRPGGNSAPLHADLMIGGSEIDVDGIDPEGHATPIIRDGAWMLQGAI